MPLPGFLVSPTGASYPEITPVQAQNILLVLVLQVRQRRLKTQMEPGWGKERGTRPLLPEAAPDLNGKKKKTPSYTKIKLSFELLSKLTKLTVTYIPESFGYVEMLLFVGVRSLGKI